MRRFWLWALLLVLLAASPAAAAGVGMSVEPAFQGRAKEGEWVTLFVDLKSEDQAVAGEVTVELVPPPGLGYLPYARYALPYSLPAGGAQRVAVSLPNEQSWPLRVELRAGGELVDQRTIELDWLRPEGLLIGVLADGGGLAGALGSLQGGEGTARVVQLRPDSLPDSPTLLGSLDIIALAGFDTGALTPRQLQALEAWVARGGTLLLFGGPDWQRTLGPLPERLLPVEITGTQEVSLAPLGDAAGVALDVTGVVSVGPLARGSALLWAGGSPEPGQAAAGEAAPGAPVLAAVLQVGSGRVVYLAFDPTLEPVSGWDGLAPLLGRVVAPAAGKPRVMLIDWRLQQAIQRIPDWGLPAVWLVGVLLAGYLVVVGPVNFLVLRRLDRREWAWLTVPVLSLVFLGAVYSLGAGRFQAGISHLITTTELVPGADAGVMTTHVGIYAPGRTRLTLPLPGGAPVRVLSTASVVGGVQSRIVAGGAAAVEFTGLTNYTMTGFSLEEPVAVSGGLELVDLVVSGGEVTGRVRNSLPVVVTGVEVLSDRSREGIGTLGPGETSEPFRISLGARLDPKDWIHPLATLEYDPDGDLRIEELRAFVWEAGQGRLGSSLLVLGWTDAPLAQPSVDPPGKRASGVNLVYAFHPIPASADGDLPAGVVVGRPVDADPVLLVGQSAYLARAGSHHFVITLPPMDPSRVAEVAIDLRGPVREAVMSVYVRNQLSGEWVPLAARRTVLPDWQQFVLPGGVIELRYDLSVEAEFMAPTVEVKGVR